MKCPDCGSACVRERGVMGAAVPVAAVAATVGAAMAAAPYVVATGAPAALLGLVGAAKLQKSFAKGASKAVLKGTWEHVDKAADKFGHWKCSASACKKTWPV